MQKITSSKELRASIVALEATQENDLKLLKGQFERVYESVRPINLIKSTIEQINESSEIKSDLIKTAVVLSAGYLSKGLFGGINNKLVKNVLSSSVVIGVVNSVMNNPAIIKNTIVAVVGFFRKNQPTDDDDDKTSLAV
jgi:hypothetical protein